MEGWQPHCGRLSMGSPVAGLGGTALPQVERGRWLRFRTSSRRSRSGGPRSKAYYHGFSNRTLWPLFHGLVDRVVLERRWWRDYGQANERFAERQSDGGASRRSALGARLPARRAVSASSCVVWHGRSIGFFLHIPFPAAELFARLPWRGQLLDGMLGADVVGFQTRGVPRNFVLHLPPAETTMSTSTGRGAAPRDGRSVTTAAHPISIDAAALGSQSTTAGVAERARSTAPTVPQAAACSSGSIASTTRRASSSGCARSSSCSSERRELRGRVAFVQIAVPSRGDIREYRELRAACRGDRRADQRALHELPAKTSRSTTCTAGCRRSGCSPTTGSPHVMSGHAAPRRHEPGRQGVRRLPAGGFGVGVFSSLANSPERRGGAARGAAVQSVRRRGPARRRSSSRSSLTSTTAAGDSSRWRVGFYATTCTRGWARRWRRFKLPRVVDALCSRQRPRGSSRRSGFRKRRSGNWN